MLYDPKWEAETKVDPFKLASVIAWLEKQPRDKTYVWSDQPDSCRGGCLIHQYLRAVGRNPVWDYGKISNLPTTGRHKFFDGDVAMEGPFTFGAALDRARKLAAHID